MALGGEKGKVSWKRDLNDQSSFDLVRASASERLLPNVGKLQAPYVAVQKAAHIGAEAEWDPCHEGWEGEGREGGEGM